MRPFKGSKRKLVRFRTAALAPLVAVPEVPPVDKVDALPLLSVLSRMKEGDYTARMPLEWAGVAGKVADGFNDVIIANQALSLIHI